MIALTLSTCVLWTAATAPPLVAPSATTVAQMGAPPAQAQEAATPGADAAGADHRLDWWREARFGLFIHWGLYALLEGRWGERDDHGEWIRTTARIPLEEYARLTERFDPVRFDADAWAALAAEAGMRYLVITSKHHDGFCLFDSELTEFDVTSTPFGRDVMQEVAEACRRHGLAPCWYHSIMDWNHPDYLPRRGWETDRAADGADFARYERFLHGQVRELLTRYGPIGVMWFDGEWEPTWTHEHGVRLYELCRELQPDVIVNNRVDKGRNDMEGLTRPGAFMGDFGTPEQQVPPRGLPGVDWESCITMNAHWGWNAADAAWKSSPELVRMLVDVVSKGGNLLLNVGPRPDGSFPPEAVERLRAIGRWMKVNGEAIHGTQASPFDALAWGRATERRQGDSTTVYLHLFQWPADGTLHVPGIWNEPRAARLLAAPEAMVHVERAAGGWRVSLPGAPPQPRPDSIAPGRAGTSDDAPWVLAVEIEGQPEVFTAPMIEPPGGLFLDRVRIAAPPTLRLAGHDVSVRFTTDGAVPTAASPELGSDPAHGAVLDGSAVVTAQHFVDGQPWGLPSQATFTKAELLPASRLPAETAPGLNVRVFEGAFRAVPDWSELTPVRHEATPNVALPPSFGDRPPERTLLVHDGYLEAPADDIYEFSLISDDGSRLWIDDVLVVDNDGLHGPLERRGLAALARGFHRIRVEAFNATGGFALELKLARRGEALKPAPEGWLRRAAD